MKVVLGISGGVDSSVAAIILKNKGYEVIGITFIFTDDFDPKDAIEVCKKLNIEHHIIDYRENFKNIVINNFINDYNNGLTPNPCVLCNKEIKFNFLYQAMTKYNADFIATGHYAKIIDSRLYESEDLNKDQTYFLASLDKNKINKLLLPLEGITKEQVREIAKEYNLINASKKDSTDVCFINENFKEYMNKNIYTKKGNVINIETNEIIGTHEGLQKYTIGQRKGLNIGGNQDRLFVVGKDIINNILYVALGDNEYLYSDSCLLTNINWIDKEYTKCSARFRYRQSKTDVTIEKIDNNNLLIKYDTPIKAVTKGQICALYNNNECLGSGIIKEVYKNNEKLWYL
ncbi:MAG: tRNA 2-thiouridine(34) synthase MnmA [Firmicutes bacterium]|nr:tRNA 2-thiouridine(34) synthase MnmA [Bacillota bacterium]